MRFLSILDTKDIGSGYHQLQQALVVEMCPGFIISVPVNFVTDFTSIPRSLRWLLKNPDDTRAAATVHDWLYGTNLPRLLGDAVFLAILIGTRVPGWKRNLMYQGVRWFGWLYRK